MKIDIMKSSFLSFDNYGDNNNENDLVNFNDKNIISNLNSECKNNNETTENVITIKTKKDTIEECDKMIEKILLDTSGNSSEELYNCKNKTTEEGDNFSNIEDLKKFLEKKDVSPEDKLKTFLKQTFNVEGEDATKPVFFINAFSHSNEAKLAPNERDMVDNIRDLLFDISNGLSENTDVTEEISKLKDCVVKNHKMLEDFFFRLKKKWLYIENDNYHDTPSNGVLENDNYCDIPSNGVLENDNYCEYSMRISYDQIKDIGKIKQRLQNLELKKKVYENGILELKKQILERENKNEIKEESSNNISDKLLEENILAQQNEKLRENILEKENKNIENTKKNNSKTEPALLNINTSDISNFSFRNEAIEDKKNKISKNRSEKNKKQHFIPKKHKNMFIQPKTIENRIKNGNCTSCSKNNIKGNIYINGEIFNCDERIKAFVAMRNKYKSENKKRSTKLNSKKNNICWQF